MKDKAKIFEEPREEVEEFGFKIRDKRFWVTENAEENDKGEMSSTAPSYVVELEQKLEESEKQLQEYITAYKKNAEEMEAFKARMENDLDRKLKNAKADILLALLPLEDNLDRAISAAGETPDPQSILDGIKMIRRLFQEQVQQIGLERIDALNKPFDPKYAEAIATVPVPEKDKDNIVLEEFETGYKIEDRLLRPAKVKVGTYTEE